MINKASSTRLPNLVKIQLGGFQKSPKTDVNPRISNSNFKKCRIILAFRIFNVFGIIFHGNRQQNFDTILHM